jgi:2-C-methyl-D-erythritol 4-phosphate cytidylyltransferase
MPEVAAIILAAGRSERMGGVDKLFQQLAGRAVIAHSLAAFAGHHAVGALIVVASEANRQLIESLLDEGDLAANVVLGGPRRRDSVAEGLAALPRDCQFVVVHDGARPLVTPDLIDAALAGARDTGAALCAVPVSDTEKRGTPDGLVRGTVAREGLWLAQTPQAFHVDVLRHAHAFVDVDVTDDAALVELMDAPVRLVPGSVRNIKLTLPEDLRLAAAILSAERS